MYISKAFKDYAPHVMGAMKLVAESYTPDELNATGMSMYVSVLTRWYTALFPSVAHAQNEFKPKVEQWGQKGIVQCAAILECIKASEQGGSATIAAAADAPAGASGDAQPGPAKPVTSGPTTAAEQTARDDASDSELSDLPSSPTPGSVQADTSAPASKRLRQSKDMTVEEYEAMLNAEVLGGGFMEGGDLYDI
jgi:hypothetical protein